MLGASTKIKCPVPFGNVKNHFLDHFNARVKYEWFSSLWYRSKTVMNVVWPTYKSCKSSLSWKIQPNQHFAADPKITKLNHCARLHQNFRVQTPARPTYAVLLEDFPELIQAKVFFAIKQNLKWYCESICAKTAQQHSTHTCIVHNITRRTETDEESQAWNHP